MQMTLGEIPLEEMKEVWYDEGLEKGISLGHAEGKAEGIAEGKAEAIRIFLNNSHDAMLVASSLNEPIEYIRKIAADNNISLR